MIHPPTWSFYGREPELQALVDRFSSRRWFFLRVTGRRRIGKTTLVLQAAEHRVACARAGYLSQDLSDLWGCF